VARSPEVGEQVEALLSQLHRQGGDAAAATGDELVRVVVDYYGTGLERIVGGLDGAALDKLIEDPLVESLLILHGLHPVPVEERIERALDRVRPYLGSHAGGVAFLGISEDGVAQLRLDGSCHGCPSSTVTVRMTIEDALLEAVPELAGVDVAGQVEPAPALLQIGMRPGAPAWQHPSAPDLPADGATSIARLDGRTVLLARIDATYYAYADRCPACAGSLAGAPLSGDLLSCPRCAGS
jgi:Fe-S cluster biogenesis protein NfuA